MTSEASSLAGHQELGNLIAIYDQNQISIEDDTDVAFTENVAERYKAYGWHVQTVDWTAGGPNGNEYVEDVQGLHDAIRAAEAETSAPSLICLKTIIGYPAPSKQNTGGIHGSKLGAEELAATKKVLGFDAEQSFVIEDEVLSHTRELVERGKADREEWEKGFAEWRQAHPDRAELYDRLRDGTLPEGYAEAFPQFPAGETVATRAASGKVINAIADTFPELWGGSADLAGSNNTTIESANSFNPSSRTTKKFSADPYGRVLHFGIREHAAAAIVNGITMSSQTRAFSGTFLIFSDYQRPAVRLGAVMQVPSIYIWTHDSIGLGEDGPTHQPVEQLSSLRGIPGLNVVRPADANETSVAWRTIMETTESPSGLALTRQNVPTFRREDIHPDGEGEAFASAEGTAKGGYVLADAPEGTSLDVVLIGTGSEVQLAVEAREQLKEKGIGARVVSMPCREWFDAQDQDYRESVIPRELTARVSVEAGIAMSWNDLLGSSGRAVSLEHFGASAAYERLYSEFGITAEAVVEKAQESIAAAK